MDFSTPKELAGRTRLPLRLVLDTAQSPIMEGVRRRDVTSRHLLYQAEGLYLDLRIERDPRGRQAVLVGQLADLGDPLCPVPPSPVLLMSDDEVLASTGTNRLGEFQMTVEPRAAMRLCLPLTGERLVEVPIDRRMTQRPGDDSTEDPA
jgi:hypothetical protein